ncbi:BH3-interacting domain death agonist isoform X1 [Heterocephalus glaber]|uniref:BH3-interacting domain death agonist n=1 Tax=Heterocephalus glaber TaxID=10181 RepID=A0AAX6NV63_HETGA|nr:BH3-interacting domain death agonist isoform X1 [Heterocephalus glaber]XP_004837652.1 BH3-interacting domain death agonist isoform X1 [Heterocephalus glaber]XP_004837653.1 BH3-interacting domain death agonist isoform X1 [Heterocephalus glaber]
MDAKVGNGAGFRDESITNLLVYSFLHTRNNSNFHPELEALGQELPVGVCLEADHDDELQTDGNRGSRLLYGGRREGDSENQEIIHSIAWHLAEIGDELDRSIQPGLVNQLAMHFRNPGLSEEGRRHYLAATVEEVMQTYATDMEQEKAKLITAMLLVRKVADHTPSLLRDIFHTTVNFINQNLLTYMRDLIRNEMN